MSVETTDEVAAGEVPADELAGRAAVVTGGSRGVGFGIATALVKAGAMVTITGRTRATLDPARAALLALRPRARVVALEADGTDPTVPGAVVERTVAEFGRLDVLVNNAQQTTASPQPVDVFDLDTVEVTFRSGLLATWRYMAAAFPHLSATRGTVVNFGSGAGVTGTPGHAAYAANKEAIRGLSRVAAREWGPRGVTVNVIDPVVRTQYAEEHPEFVDLVERSFPLRRFGDGERHVGGLVVFLASEQGSYMTGSTFDVDGGASIRP